VPFVKGHCGWDAVTLLLEGSIPADRELEAALRILDGAADGGLEVGFLGPGEGAGEIRVRMVDSTTRGWISMCGGMTQVIGKALVESSLRHHFKLDASAATLDVKLMTVSGVIPIHMDLDRGRVRRTTTVMDHYAAYVYERGVANLTFDEVPVLQADDMMMVDITALERRYPGVDFTRRDPGLHLDIVHGLLRRFEEHRQAGKGAIGMLYDQRPEGPGQFRVFPRFLSPDLSAAKIPYEFQCGTGTVGVGIALAHEGRLSFKGEGRIILEWGSQRATPDPYGIRTSDLAMGLVDGRVRRAKFSHSVVELVAEGALDYSELGLDARPAAR